tara:strand:+ start:144 stop:632 length:489 start_codon:yes stop_codon:yes gene_type:complete
MSELRTNKIVPRDGLPSGAIGGGIIQVVRAQNTTANQTPSSTSTWTDVQPTVTITPTRSSNLIIVEPSVTCLCNNHGYVGFRLLRGSTAIREWWTYSLDSNWSPLQGPGKHIDNPATTSAVTYKFQIWVSGGTAAYFMWNYQGPTGTNALRQAEVYAMELSA